MADALKLPEPKLWTLGAPADGKVLTGIKPTAGGGVPVFTAGQVADAILAERERCARAVPTSWLDPLMVMRVPAGCPEIEALCRRIAEAIRDGNAGVQASDEFGGLLQEIDRAADGVNRAGMARRFLRKTPMEVEGSRDGGGVDHG